MNSNDEISMLLLHQLSNYWIDIRKEEILEAIPEALICVDNGFKGINSPRFSKEGVFVFNPLMTIHWMVFLYRLSNILYKKGNTTSASQVYYLNKIMHANDWFYAIELPEHFLCEHPLGSVLGRAKYGDFFMIYQGTTVGGSRKNGELFYPEIGKNVVMFANSSILGKSFVGDNVMIAAGTKIINDEVPSNCIVFGSSPNLIIKTRDENVIKQEINNYWR